MFFLCFRWARTLDLGCASHVFFSAQRAHKIVADFEKTVNLGDKKNIPKKNKFISRDKKYFSSYVFLACFFRRPHQLFFK